MDRLFVSIGSIAAFLGVALGAFGAHGVRGRLPADLIAVYEVGVRYHLIHALALLAVAWVVSRWPSTPAVAAGWCFVVGILLFSGSLYALSLTGMRQLGVITPVGGLAFLAGWLLVGWSVWRAP